MKQLFAFILILIGYLATVIGATMINSWFGVLTCGLWAVIMGLVIIFDDHLNKNNQR